MSNHITLQQLKLFLWEAADIFRGYMESSDFKNYIFGILFFKRLSDSFDEAREKVMEYNLAQGKTLIEATALACHEVEYVKTVYIPKVARWAELIDFKHHVGEALNTAAEAIEKYNPNLEGVLTSINYNIKNKLPDNMLRDLLSHFNKYRLRNSDFEHPDILGIAFEYLIKEFADSEGKKGGEFYTPSEVVYLLVELLKPNQGMQVYDPTAGTGGMLIQMRNHLTTHNENAVNLSLYGQEINLNTWAICQMNMFLHGVQNADIRKGDTLREPKHIFEGSLMTFDRVIANPPFSLTKWGKEECDNDKYGRFPYGTPQHSGDLAFLQHIIASTNEQGMAGVVISNGGLYRSSSEKDIRKGILKDDLLEAVIGLPAGLFYGTSTPACLLIINKKKNKERQGRVIFIDASHDFESMRSMNRLRSIDIEAVINAFQRFEDIGTFSKIINVETLIANEANLSITRYVDNSPILREIAQLLTHHDGFERISLHNKELVNTIKVAKYDEMNKPSNAIYLRRHAPERSPVLLSLTEEIKESSYIEVVFNKEKLLNQYAKLFFESSLGKLMLSHIPTGVSIQMLQANSVRSLNIPIPSTDVQDEVIKVASKLLIAKEQIDIFFSKLTTEPKQYKIIEDNTDSMVYTLSTMSDVKHLKHLIEMGETRQMEFKQSFFANVDKIRSEEKLVKNRDVQAEVIKDIASFMNSDGGTLLIGVTDNKVVTGVELELQRCGWKKMDSYIQELGAQLESRLGKNYHQFCKITEVKIEEHIIARIDCIPSPYPIFLDKVKFHVRTDTSSPALEGEAMLKYIQNRFKGALFNE